MRLIAMMLVAFFNVVDAAHAAPGDLLFKLTAPDPQPGAGFGEVLAATDGNIVVGEPERLIDNIAFVGQAYVFDAQSGALRFTLKEPEPINRSTFGTSIAMGDGAIYLGGGGIANRGRVHVFDHANGMLRNQIEGPNGGDDGFASAMAYGGGDLLVAAPSYDLNGELFAVGQVYLYDPESGQLRLTVP